MNEYSQALGIAFNGLWFDVYPFYYDFIGVFEMKTAQLILKNGDSINRPIIEVELIEKPLWWQLRGLSYTASGYGKKIPTAYMVRYKGRLYRVYCCIFSNSGTCYIRINGVDNIVEIN